jgi:hypothetical protein
VLRVSGTIRKVEEHAIEVAKEMIKRAKGGSDGANSLGILKDMAAATNPGLVLDSMDVDDDDESGAEDLQTLDAEMEREEDLG